MEPPVDVSLSEPAARRTVSRPPKRGEGHRESERTVNPRRTSRDIRHRVLLSRARAGHEQSFRALFRALYAPAYGYVRRRIDDEGDAEDVTARVFHRFLEQLDRFDPEKGSVWTWIMTLARHAVIDHWRARRFETESIEPLIDVLACGADTPLERLVRDEDDRLHHPLLHEESDDVREILALHLVEGMTYREVAGVVGSSEAAVKQKSSRALRRLRSKQATLRREKPDEIAPEGTT